MNDEQNQKMMTTAKDVTIGMVIKSTKLWFQVTEIDKIEKKKGGYRYEITGVTVPQVYGHRVMGRTEKVEEKGGRVWSHWFNDCSTKVKTR